MCSDVDSIRKHAEAAQSCLVTHSAPAPMAMLSDLQRKVTELTEELIQSQNLLSKKTSGEETLGTSFVNPHPVPSPLAPLPSSSEKSVKEIKKGCKEFEGMKGRYT